MVYDLNICHHRLHRVTGSMATRFNKAATEDLQRWSRELHKIACEMEAEADQCENELEDEIAFP
jgi:hypothetical protein